VYNNNIDYMLTKSNAQETFLSRSRDLHKLYSYANCS